MRIELTADKLNAAGCALIPTMGALHEGHLSLVRLARARTDRPVVATVFVNPTQFNDPADLERYPRDLERDAVLCAEAGADIVFAPAVETVYPPDQPRQPVTIPPVAHLPQLEDAGRPGHFEGVCQVVSRLFDLCQPVAAVFGEKDWQQLQTVRAMVTLQHRPIDIWAGPIVRESDGLAMSSRNTHLDDKHRLDARALYRALNASTNAPDPSSAEALMHAELEAINADIQYAAVRDAETLMPLVEHTDRPARALVCAFVGGVRLLDNAPWQPRRQD